MVSLEFNKFNIIIFEEQKIKGHEEAREIKCKRIMEN